MTAAAHANAPAPPASAAMRSFEAQWAARAQDPLSPLRAQAMQRFLALGLPSTRDETWRYTDLRGLAGVHYVDAPLQERGAIEPLASVALFDRSQRAATVMMVNGHPWLHTIDSVINDIEVKSFEELFRLDPKLLLSFVDPVSDADERRFDLLNTALFVD